MRVCKKCGCNRFYGHQVVRMDIICTSLGFERNVHENISEDIYDSETPYGPFTCVKCGAEYEDLEELPEESAVVEEQPKSSPMSKKEENLRAIRDWCKSVALDDIVYIDNAVCCNGRYFKLSISKQNGIGAFGNGKFSKWLHVDGSRDSLVEYKVGSEIIYNWKEIKQRILSALDEHKRKKDAMENFVV